MVAEAVTPAQNSTQRKTRAIRALARVAAYGVPAESIRRSGHQQHSKKSVRLIAVNLTLLLFCPDHVYLLPTGSYLLSAHALLHRVQLVSDLELVAS